MVIRELEKAILSELILVSRNNKIKLKDIMEWSTGEINAQEGETLYYLPELKVNCAVKIVKKDGKK
jgi:hypothetical protein